MRVEGVGRFDQSDSFVNALYVEPRTQGWGEGITEALNACLATVNLGDFDYIIRVTLTPNFRRTSLVIA